jgi:hypothetical protein
MIHVPGAGDFALNDIIRLPDPCPLPGSGDGVTQQSLKKDAKLYAPMADVGGVLMDEDAMYIDIGGQVGFLHVTATWVCLMDRLTDRPFAGQLHKSPGFGTWCRTSLYCGC